MPARFIRAMLLFAALIPILFRNAFAQTCYYPNGDVAEGMGTCLPSGDGPCCPYQWDCVSNGLCYLEGAGYYGRYTCTDSGWQSSSCPQFCTQEYTASGNEAVLQCRDGSWCCDGNRSFNCCGNGNTDFFSLPSPSLVAYISKTVAGSQAQSSTIVSKPLSTTSGITSQSQSPISSSADLTTSTSSASYSSTRASTTTTFETTTDSAGKPTTVTIIRYPSSTPPPHTTPTRTQAYTIALIFIFPLIFVIAIGYLVFTYRKWKLRRAERARRPQISSPRDFVNMTDLSHRVQYSHNDDHGGDDSHHASHISPLFSAPLTATTPHTSPVRPTNDGPYELESPVANHYPPSAVARSPAMRANAGRWSELEGDSVMPATTAVASEDVSGGGSGERGLGIVSGEPGSDREEGEDLTTRARDLGSVHGQGEEGRMERGVVGGEEGEDGGNAVRSAFSSSSSSSPTARLQELWGGDVPGRLSRGEEGVGE